MEKKESTPQRVSRRKYEETHKEERKSKTRLWGTMLDRAYWEKIDEFLSKHNITKVEVITAGYIALQQRYEKNNLIAK